MEMDDDAYFADLSRQIALLIMDDDEEYSEQRPSPVPVQYAPQASMPPPFNYEMTWRRESKGTGVFIPRSLCPRRRNKSRRSAPIGTSSYSQTDKSSGITASRNTVDSQFYSKNSYYNNTGVPQRQP